MEPASKKSRSSGAEEKAIISKVYKDRFTRAHYNDYGTNVFYFTTGHLGSIVHLTDINQGTSYYDRVGKRIKFKSVQLHGVIYWGPLAPTYPLLCTLFIIWDRYPSTTLPSISDIIYPASAIGFNHDDNSDRFRFLYRKSFGVSFTMQDPIPLDIYLDLKGCNAEYGSATNGQYGNVRYGALLMLTMGLESNVPPYDQAARMFASIRSRFVNEL